MSEGRPVRSPLTHLGVHSPGLLAWDEVTSSGEPFRGVERGSPSSLLTMTDGSICVAGQSFALWN